MMVECYVHEIMEGEVIARVESKISCIEIFSIYKAIIRSYFKRILMLIMVFCYSKTNPRRRWNTILASANKPFPAKNKSSYAFCI